MELFKPDLQPNELKLRIKDRFSAVASQCKCYTLWVKFIFSPDGRGTLIVSAFCVTDRVAGEPTILLNGYGGTLSELIALLNKRFKENGNLA